MDETRRNLMKGMLTGGTLLALGIPGITQAVSINQSLSDKTQNCRLLLGNTQIGEMFSRGALLPVPPIPITAKPYCQQ